MKIDWKWTALIALLAFALLLPGCSKKPPETAPPPPPTVTEAPPTTDIEDTSMAKPVDPVEKPVEKSIAQIQEDAENQGLLGDVFYSFDKYDLSADAKSRLARNAEFMKGEGNDLAFTIEGHCDERGTNEYNIALGQRRSTAALDYLVSMGVPASRFKTISYGEEKPFCRESSEACWQKNRRARFVITSRTGN